MSLLEMRKSKFFSPMADQFVLERYGVALAAALLAVLSRWLLDPVLGHVAFYITVYAGAAFCVLVCGYGPAIVSALVGFFGIFYWFVDPRHSLSLIRPSEIHGVIGFFLVSTFLISLGEANRRKQLKLSDMIEALLTEATERRRAEAALQRAHDELEQRVVERTTQLSQLLAKLETEIGEHQKDKEQLRQLSLRLMTLQDEERRHIARELHDTTGQTLAAIKMTAARIQRSAVSEQVQRLVEDLNALTDGAVQEIRTTSYLLHPPLLDEAGIASAMRWFVEGFAKRSGIQVECKIEDSIPRPARNQELVLFRILQESLTNVHRHSGASAAQVRLALNSGQFILEICDNGLGIPQERLQQFREAGGSVGVGLVGMRERVNELSGHVEIESSPTGTRITVKLPVTACLEIASSHSTSAA
jgi:signal transduction histidine kinase